MRTLILGWLLVGSVPMMGWSQDSLKILSWNIQMLPRGVNQNGKAKRARAIVQQLNQSDYDVIVFQELFYKRSRRIICRSLRNKYPFQTRVLNKKLFSFKTNGGVVMISKYAITDIHQIKFKEKSGPDRFSRKGALFAELDVAGKPVQLIGTHLQAFGLKEIMYSQYQQIGTELLVRYKREHVPQIVCGDFNTLKSVPSTLPANLPPNFEERIARYPVMLQTLGVEDGDLTGEHQYTMDRPNNDLCKTRKEFRLLLDYFLLRRNQSGAYVQKRQIRIMKYPWHKNHQDLSDHYGLEAIISGY